MCQLSVVYKQMLSSKSNTLYSRRAIGGIGNKAGQNQSGLQLEVVTVDTTVLPLDIDT